MPAVSIVRGLVEMTLRTPPKPQEAPSPKLVLVQQSPTNAATQRGRLEGAGVPGLKHCEVGRHSRHRWQTRVSTLHPVQLDARTCIRSKTQSSWLPCEAQTPVAYWRLVYKGTYPKDTTDTIMIIPDPTCCAFDAPACARAWLMALARPPPLA